MSDLLSSTSMGAMTLGATYPKTTVADGVELRIVYDPFRPQEVEIHELEFRADINLAEYVGDLPAEAGWMLFHNGSEVDLVAAKTIVVEAGDRVGLIMVPLGNTVKSILRVVMMVAFVAIGTLLGGPLGAAIGAIAATLISSLLLAPKPPKSVEEEGQSYGIDGAKNSATEGIPFPVVYGEFRTAGNFADVYTENVGDDQYLNLRSILNDGEIEGIYDVEINEQPVANFKNVSVEKKLGTATQTVSPWFGRSLVQHNKGIKLSTAETKHETTQAVDMIRFDLSFPEGLVNIDEKKGTHRPRSVSFEMQYRPLDPITRLPIGAWATLPHNMPSYDAPPPAPGGFLSSLLNARITATIPVGTVSSSFTPAVEYQASGSPTWLPVGDFTDIDGSDYLLSGNNVVGTYDSVPLHERFFDIDLAGGNYAFRGINGATVTNIVAYPQGGTGTGIVSDQRTRQIRRSFYSERLARGFYEVSIRRTTVESTNAYILDKVFLTDVGEIDLDPMTLRHTAYLGLKVKLDDQLSQIPLVTARVKGSLLQEYDIDGNPTVKRWSANNSWIALDILTNAGRGAGLNLQRVDFPAHVEFAKYCDDNQITFNGVFDAGTNVGDALRHVLRIGHAVPIPFGTRISLAVDRPRSPVQMFSSGNIIGDFQVSYIAMNDRANEFEVAYYDKTDKNKQKSLRYVDQKAVTFNEAPRPASITLAGIDNAAQAKAELWRMIYSNRLLVRTVSFTAAIEAISLLIGDVALLQHPQMDWGEGGRTRAATTTVVELDQPVTVVDGESYAILVRQDAVKFLTATVSSVIGNRIFIPTTAAIDPANVARLKRVTLTSNSMIDHGVTKVEKGVVYDTLYFASAPAGIVNGAQIDLWDLDSLEERPVLSVEQMTNGNSRVTVSIPFSMAPTPYSTYTFGKVSLVSRPYTLTGMSGEGIEKRRLTFIEYDEGVYAPPELDLPTPVTRVTDRNVNHVKSLLFDYEILSQANRTISNCRVHWASGNIINYAGADVYMSLNGSAERPIATAVNSSEVHVQLAPGDEVVFRVVAKNKSGDMAPYGTSPKIGGTIAVTFAPLDPPTNFVQAIIDFEAAATTRFTWDAPAIATGVESYEMEYKLAADAVWTGTGVHINRQADVAGLTVGTYDCRVRSISATSVSSWLVDAFIVLLGPGSLLELKPSEPGADVTSGITGLSEITINADSSGTVTTALPKVQPYSLVRNGVDVTTAAAWSVTVVSGAITAAIGAATGLLSLSLMGGVLTNSVIRISVSYAGTVRTTDVRVSKVSAGAPSAGSSGGTSATGTVNGSTNSASMVAIGSELTITLGSAGTATLSSNYLFSTGANSGSYGEYAQWYRWNGSAFVAIGTEVAAILNHIPVTFEDGEGDCGYTATGLTPSSTQKFRLFMRNSSGAITRNINGSCSVVGG